jgi:hypothetical protein
MDRFCTARVWRASGWVSEVSGLDFGRRKFVRRLDQMIADKASMIVVAP